MSWHRLLPWLGMAALAACGREPEPVMPKDPVRTPTPRPAAVAAPAPAAAVSTPLLAAVDAVPETPPPGAAEVTEAIERWRSAWQAKDLVAYLAFYDPGFEGDGLDLAGWSARKRDVFARAGELAVGVEDLDVRAAPEGVVAEFTQAYRSGKLADRGHKTLLWIEVDGRWRIRKESFRKPR